eukprot:m51a1_g2329 putative zinc finger matrin-type protein 2 (177) ;mRNA; f:514507-518393
MSKKEEEGTPAFTVDAFGRRKWNAAYYASHAPSADSDAPRRPVPPPERDLRPLRAREAVANLDTRVGKAVVSVAAPLSERGGFYCEVCDCTLKDSSNFLDHLNSQKHQRLKGVSMRAERATLEQVRARLAAAANAKRVHSEMTPSKSPKEDDAEALEVPGENGASKVDCSLHIAKK